MQFIPQLKVGDFSLGLVKNKKHSQIKTYIDFAQIFNDDNGSWLSRALKQRSIGGLHVSPET